MNTDPSMDYHGAATILPRSGAPLIDSEGGEDGTYARQLAIAERRAAIRLHAYYRAERRGFLPGHELDDWLAAERQISELDAMRERQYSGQIQA
jgi:hypothetical protein